MKRTRILWIAAAAAAVILSGCAGKKAPEETETAVSAEETEESAAPEETPEETEDALSKLNEAPEDAGEQIAVIADSVETWAVDDEYGTYGVGYAVTDLDRNGRLEVISYVTGGTGMYTTSEIWEVNEKKDGVDHVSWEKEEGDSEPDAIGSIRQTAYVDEKSGTIYYICPDYMRNGVAENYEILYALSLSDGAVELQDLAGRHETLDASGNSTLEYWDAEGSSISEEEYEKTADTVFGRMTKTEFSIIWLDSENLGTTDGIQSLDREVLLKKLGASFDGFGFEAVK